MNRVTRTVTAREANQQFPQLLAAVERGEEVTITKHGKPIATIAPVSEAGRAEAEAKRRAAVERAIELMREGLPLGGPFTRDEMHDD
jgi:prevent-host-death family protein